MQRLWAARVLAWALLLGGWVALASLAAARSATLGGGLTVLALWLLAVGAATQWLPSRLPHATQRRLALLLSAAATALAVQAPGRWALPAAALAWAALVVLASLTVRACRQAAPRRPGPPTAAAAAGGALVWALMAATGAGSLPASTAPLAQALSLALPGVALLLALLHPRQLTGHSRCRAGLFDCSLPAAWPAGAWRQSRQWPLALASLVMLPMMCSLALMPQLCRSNALLPPAAMLALHLGAMLGPAAVIRGRAVPVGVVSGLLAAGALALWALPAPWAWPALAVLHGSAWSLAWTGQLLARGPAKAPSGDDAHRGLAPPWRVAAFNAVWAVALGAALDAWGPSSLAGVHGLLGGLVLGAAVFRWAGVRPAATAAEV
jgi:hypothetical protein